jgi:hypothetical protein
MGEVEDHGYIALIGFKTANRRWKEVLPILVGSWAVISPFRLSASLTT